MSNTESSQLVWHTEKRAVDTLVSNKKSPRKISKEQMENLKKSFTKFDLVEIPAIDLDGTILAGHQRIKVLKEFGRSKEEIDVRVPNRQLTEEEAERYLIASNSIHAEFDRDLLKAFDMNLLVDLGFNQKELDEIWNKKLQKDINLEDELSKLKEPRTKLGDVILLGTSKLICGNSLEPETLEKLFGDERASMIFSDPVYNLGVDYDKGLGGGASYGGTVDDHKTDEEYKEFLKKSMECALAVTKEDAHVFYFSDCTYIWLIQTLYRELGITNRRVCLWIKNGANPTPGVSFNKCYEPATYGTRNNPHIVNGVNNINEVMNPDMTTGNDLIQQVLDTIDVWPVKRLPGNEYEHSTMKPPELYEKAIRRCTRMNEIILDSFSGSGSTIMAGVKLNRRVYAVELEPKFCDLTIRRYEAMTGLKAKIIRNDEEIS